MMILQVILGVAGIAVSCGVPVGLFILQGFRDDVKALRVAMVHLNERIDQHISNYAIHGGK